MSEINVAAVLYPKPEKFDELAALIAEVTTNVQANEPDTLVYYAIRVQKKNEIVIIERYKNQAAVQAHLKAPYFRKFSAKLPELLAKPVELRSGTLLEGSCVVSRL
ncbi:uncharacterized protein TrAFT101_009441 [Trichoderma asperellum]|uniref:ABM domain-containing protein n=1 Tax=Trichoderma asperellum (strain ATCC 204424 / CBS 433.97 / NBRC 101777) TaxID=1042311 RepID=A0A2T3YQR7_TRIA4|nr:hypothetical protein M441DRAFT_94182 [Trichoderma asperellum CBS 433.97]PTB34913.1 hypothetical protein M441DRAFT_94182 [Trichoderma asperellum CBS 433.97]UKZ94574.1 hypothetical protein TrAFT101_009441 [Trichoderma asperellum]WVH32695.1 antibiotic biosynthesis monooxygenase [Trichoderma asperellum]